LFEYLVGLHVTDDQLYGEYRKAMLPILEECGGGFRYDFKVSDVLISETENKVNRVFVIYFPDRETLEKFFSNTEYLKVKKDFFKKSVENTTIISKYER
jgi:uncharacterized protein (DUF1330 family)